MLDNKKLIKKHGILLEKILKDFEQSILTKYLLKFINSFICLKNEVLNFP